ncbi:MAG: threonine/serine exporter family protein [Oscillospiraceae bacterium]|nr:threonine/serine exporter family protein [Oscillospiraceae bacterium]
MGMQTKELISCAMDIGAEMLICGAEVRRVERTVQLIGKAYGCRHVDVFTITSSMVVTVQDAQGEHTTLSRRISKDATDLYRLHRLNDLSREICRDLPSYEYIRQRFEEIVSEKRFPVWLEILAAAVAAGGFAVFFGGGGKDALGAFVLGIMTRLITYCMDKAGVNQLFGNLAASFVLSLGAAGAVLSGFVQDAAIMIIGTIMLLIPGRALTNSLRDMIDGDMMSGLLRFLSAILSAVAIAAGYLLAAQVAGGAL